MRPLQGSLAEKTKASDCGVRCRAPDKVLTHESKLSARHCDLPDSELTQEQPGSIMVRVGALTF